MRLALLVLFVFTAYGNIAASRYPAEGYSFHPYANNPSQQEEAAQARQIFWAIRDLLTNNIPRSTVRATFTAVVSMTCTKSVFRNCRISQEPFARAADQSEILGSEIIEAEKDDGEQYPVAPTIVQQVESTLLPARQTREANPQYFLNPRLYPNQFQDIQSALYNSPYDSLPIGFRNPYLLPTDGQRQLSSQMPAVTLTVSTVFKINMITQTPRCSRAGPIPQCANA